MDFNKLITIVLSILVILSCCLIVYYVFKIDESFKLENFESEDIDKKCLSKGCKFFKNKIFNDSFYVNFDNLKKNLNEKHLVINCSSEEDCKRQFCSISNALIFLNVNNTNQTIAYKLKEGLKLEEIDDSFFDEEIHLKQQEGQTLGFCLEKFKTEAPKGSGTSNAGRGTVEESVEEQKMKTENFANRRVVLGKVYRQLLQCLSVLKDSNESKCNNTSKENNKLNLLNIVNKQENKSEFMTFIRKSCAVMNIDENRDISFFINFKNPNLNKKTYIFSLVNIVTLTENNRVDKSKSWDWDNIIVSNRNKSRNRKYFLFSIFYSNGELSIEYTDKNNKFTDFNFKLSLVSNQNYFIHIEKMKEKNKYMINFTGDKTTIEFFNASDIELQGNQQIDKHYKAIFGDIENTIFNKDIVSEDITSSEDYFTEELYTIKRPEKQDENYFTSTEDELFSDYKCKWTPDKFKKDTNLGLLQNRDECYKTCMKFDNGEKCNSNYCKYVCDNCLLDNCIWNSSKINKEEQELPYAPKITCFADDQTVIVKWNKVVNNLYPVLAYVLTVIKLENGKPSKNENVKILTLPGNIETYEIKDLENQTYYHISMQSQNKNGLSEDCSNTEIIAPNGPLKLTNVNYVLNTSDQELLRDKKIQIQADFVSKECRNLFNKNNIYENEKGLGSLFKNNVLSDYEVTKNTRLSDRILKLITTDESDSIFTD